MTTTTPARTPGTVPAMVRDCGRTVWRDATGRITRQGDLRAVTATCSDGRVYDVSGDNPVLVIPNAEGESRAASARTLHPLVGSLDGDK
jgi:hypothetical protein